MTTTLAHNGRNGYDMATQGHQTDKMRPQFTAVNAYLYTPPENTADSFSHEEMAQPVKDPQYTLPPLQSHTPPASPPTNALEPSITTAIDGYSTQDDVPLFPERRTDRAQSQTPLFDNDRSQTPPRSQSAPSGESKTHAPYAPHAGRTTNLSIKPTAPAKPTAEQYFPDILGVQTSSDALAYWHSRKGELREMRKGPSALPSPKLTMSKRRNQLDMQHVEKLSKRTGITKPQAPPRPVARTKAATTTSHSEKPTPPRRRATPKARNYNDFVESAFPSGSQQTKHKRAPPSKKVESDNVSWSELPDYSPPTSSLDSNAKTLKASWQGNPVDLKDDINRAHLHPQEFQVAATLRLTCAQFLSNKRKIFQARLQALKDGKNFTKTAAQGACAIDVNKASQLWEAFDRVGWFKESWFEQYL